jgi:hypothetical protein
MLAALLISGLPALAVNNPLFNAHAAKICSKCYYILKYVQLTSKKTKALKKGCLEIL